MTVANSLLLGVGALLAVFGAVRVMREPRRISTGLVLLAATVLLAVWAVSVLHIVAPGPALEVGVGLMILLPILSLLAGGVGLVANGVVITRREGLRIATAIAPVVGVGLIALPLIAYQVIDPGTDRPLWVPVLAAAVTLIGLQILVQLLAFTGYAVLYARLPRRVDSDAIVVLGCGLRDAAVTPLLASRLDRAVEVYRSEVQRGGTPLLVTSGGQGPGETVAEADAMADYLEAQGIPRSEIVRENRSRNTEENLRFTLRELRGHDLDPAQLRITVVTSDFHVLRTATLTRRVGLNAQVAGSRTARYFVPAAFLREFAAILVTHKRVNLAIAGVLLTLVGAVAIYSMLPVGLVISD
ncbi:YdcF family protein [Nocardia sp. NPDC020380]|uniref:YdcF family protein n=1 Tax=Nocardia sp. NPDC020380 TaxID=3364309 RepID=UPI0037A8C3F0